ncbi:hypothetical protein OG948_21190 [Embleya sp. NBC_00888]|uniref:hypothetical protein n=1 Tax=Embleya sp. NBC_00888 TaxID=2975960 RepID=UPI003866E244|nr:hypothetical protein OG948_21190 [Embleya sp. NBC_00888]
MNFDHQAYTGHQRPEDTTMSTETEPATWVVGDWATTLMPDGDRARGQVVKAWHDGDHWLAEVVLVDGGDHVTVLAAAELWPDA